MRCIDRVISGRRVSDGAGVNICRVIGQPGSDYIDPVLMFDDFCENIIDCEKPIWRKRRLVDAKKWNTSTKPTKSILSIKKYL